MTEPKIPIAYNPSAIVVPLRQIDLYWIDRLTDIREAAMTTVPKIRYETTHEHVVAVYAYALAYDVPYESIRQDPSAGYDIRRPIDNVKVSIACVRHPTLNLCVSENQLTGTRADLFVLAEWLRGEQIVTLIGQTLTHKVRVAEPVNYSMPGRRMYRAELSDMQQPRKG